MLCSGLREVQLTVWMSEFAESGGSLRRYEQLYTHHETHLD